MPVSVTAWRQRIGCFYCFKISKSRTVSKPSSFLSALSSWFSRLSIFEYLPIRVILGFALLFLYSAVILLSFIWVLLYHEIVSNFLYIFSNCDFYYYFVAYYSTSTVFPMSILLAKKVFACFSFNNFHFVLFVLSILLVSSGSVETNPGPKPDIKNYLSFAMWNLDSLPARDYSRISVIESLQAVHDFDLFAICESSLHEQISNENLLIHGFAPEPLRADKPLIAHNGGVCLFFKGNIPLKRRKDLEILEETLVVEIRQKNNKKLFFVVSYRHPNLSSEETDLYFSSLNIIIERIDSEKPIGIILTGDFNARSPFFWENDADTKEGQVLCELAISNHLEELICEPTHIRDDGSQSCIDLIFTDQKYAFTNVQVIPHSESQSKHLIVHGKINFSVPCPPPYKGKIWDYEQANYTKISEELNKVDWENLFLNKDVDEMTKFFSETYMLILSENIPNRIVTFNDKDAPWITIDVKSAIRRNYRVYRKWVLRGRSLTEKDLVRTVQNETNRLIKKAKIDYFNILGSKLSDYNTGSKTFWTAFKRLVNKKKLSNIPPILDDGKIISDFRQKCTIFNDYFAKQCTLNVTPSVLPPVKMLTEFRLSQITTSEDKIKTIILNLNSKKAHGCDEISIAMLKLCAPAVAKPLNMIFDKCLSEGTFPNAWKLANVQPIHKKDCRQTKSNYRPISLLPVCGKILERIVFNDLYSFLNNNNLISSDQSGFRPGDSTINQLISITSDIFESFEDFDETRALFLDISKAFDKVWHEGLIFKLKGNGISGPLLNFFVSYLQGRHQRVVLNGIQSEWKVLEAGVPQGSVLGPLLFLVYINDLPENIKAKMKLFADDSSLFTRVSDVNSTHRLLENDLRTIEKWGHQWKMVFNPDITKQAVEVIFSAKKDKTNHPLLEFNNIPVARKPFTKHLGLYLDEKLSFSKHIKEKISKAMNGIALLKFLSKHVSKDVLNLSYKMYVRPHLDYGDVIYHNSRSFLMNLIEQVQYKAALVVTGCWQGTSRIKLYNELGWESLSDRRWFRRLTYFYKIVNRQTPEYLHNHLPPLHNVQYNLRRQRVFVDLKTRTQRHENSFFPYCVSEWEKLSEEIKASPTITQFKNNLLMFIRPVKRLSFGINDIHGIKLITKMRVEFSDLRSHRFHHNFNCVDPRCSCLIEDETNSHFLLRCPLYLHLRQIFLGNVSTVIGSDVSILPHGHLSDILLFGSNVFF